MENNIKKLLIGFFVMMLVFTFVSRAAASAMVAKVRTDTVKQGNLTYEVSGTGIIKANAHHYIDLINGNKIGKVSVKQGQKVKRGDLLFVYDLNQLKEKEADSEASLKKLQLQYQKIGLINSVDDGSVDENTANLVVKNAKEDILSAKQDIKEKKKQLKKAAEKELREAVTSLNEVKASKEEAEKTANRAVADASNELAKILEPESSAKEKIDNYEAAVVRKNDVEIENGYYGIFNYYYDYAYDEHTKQVSDAKKVLARAKEDLEGIQKKWDHTAIAGVPYGDSDAQDAYYNQLETKRNEIGTATRAVDDAEESLSRLTKKDLKLSELIGDYRDDLEENSVDAVYTYNGIYTFLTAEIKKDQSQVADAKTKLSRAQEDEQQSCSDWAKKLQAASDKKEKLDQKLAAMKDGSYDYSEDIRGEKKALKDAERALETAENQVNQVRDTKLKSEESQQKQKESDEIDRNAMDIDIAKSQKELMQLQTIISDQGKVKAPVSGVISENNLEQGITLSGQEKLVITTGGYELSMSTDKKELQHFTVGDEIDFKTGLNKQTITSQIENIELPDSNGKVTFTALLPKGEYQIGSSLEYDLKKDSKEYSMTVPIEALRQDSQGTYVLLVKDADSVLGKVQEAFRMNIKLISKDAKSAAVDASLSEDDKIIVSSNRNFSEGDRVRIYETE